VSSKDLFELGGAYDELLRRGIALAGESPGYFIDGRIAHLRSRLGEDTTIKSILDLGCGVGDACARLADAFGASVTGVDVARGAVEEARRRIGDERVQFALLGDLADTRFDLCYVNGAFHHMAASQWPGVTRRIAQLVRPGGVFALFENNPWSVPARLVMRRIPFDRDVTLLRPAVAQRLLEEAGFATAATDYLFFFPRRLKSLRRGESLLQRVPLGAQYLVTGRRS